MGPDCLGYHGKWLTGRNSGLIFRPGAGIVRQSAKYKENSWRVASWAHLPAPAGHQFFQNFYWLRYDRVLPLSTASAVIIFSKMITILPFSVKIC